MRDSLIDIITTAIARCSVKRASGETVDKAAVIADVLIDKGVITLPIKVGQTVYVPWCYAFQRGIATVKVEEIKFYDSQMRYMFFIDMESDNECFNQSFGGWKIEKAIGVTVFLTREEAERALKGANDGRN